MKHVALVALGSDDGLCGAYNANIFKRLLAQIQQYKSTYGENIEITIIPVGAKINKATAKIVATNVKLSTEYQVNSKSSGDSVKDFVIALQEKFIAGELDKIDVLYMNFKSASRQIETIDQLLPVVQDSFGLDNKSFRPYIFEPDANKIFASVLPLFLLSMMQEVFCENRASEQAARIMAMQSANDNAKKLLDQLRLEYNKLRQQSITNELLDIVGGQVKQ